MPKYTCYNLKKDGNKNNYKSYPAKNFMNL